MCSAVPISYSAASTMASSTPQGVLENGSFITQHMRNGWKVPPFWAAPTGKKLEEFVDVLSTYVQKQPARFLLITPDVFALPLTLAGLRLGKRYTKNTSLFSGREPITQNHHVYRWGNMDGGTAKIQGVSQRV